MNTLFLLKTIQILFPYMILNLKTKLIKYIKKFSLLQKLFSRSLSNEEKVRNNWVKVRFLVQYFMEENKSKDVPPRQLMNEIMLSMKFNQFNVNTMRKDIKKERSSRELSLVVNESVNYMRN